MNFLATPLHISLFLIVCWFGLVPLQAQDKYYFPERGETWRSASPSAFGMDATAIDEAVAFAQANEYSGGVLCQCKLSELVRQQTFTFIDDVFIGSIFKYSV